MSSKKDTKSSSKIVKAPVKTAKPANTDVRPVQKPVLNDMRRPGGGRTIIHSARPKATVSFNVGEHVVYPPHGVGKMVAEETKEVAGTKCKLFVIEFADDRMTLRVPTASAAKNGLRNISDKKTMKAAIEKLKARPKIRRAMWSRRAQHYDSLIRSGDPVSIAEVVRELYRKDDQAEQSYSERQIYQTALERLASEFSVIENISFEEAEKKITSVMKKAA